MKLRNLALAVTGFALFALTAMAQQGSMQGDVKGPDGKPLPGAMVKIDRTDIKAHYQVKTDKKGHYFHAGLPYGTYTVSIDRSTFLSTSARRRRARTRRKPRRPRMPRAD